jgi:hypothetical protein
MPEGSPTAVPPEATGWVTRQIQFDDDCCGIDDIEVTAAAGGTIHAVDHEEEAWDPGGSDAGRYRRSIDGGRSWDAEHQIPGIGEVVAATGNRVFVAFVAYTCGRPAIGVVRNNKNGAPNAWSRVTCLPGYSDASLSTWGPKIAATGSSVFVISIDPRTKKVHLRTSHDSGRTFESELLGDARPDAEDNVGPVVLGADDDLVAASWPDKGQQVIRLSRDRGRSWGSAIPLPPVNELSVRDGRILVQGWYGTEEPWYQLASDGAFAPIVVPWPTPKWDLSGEITTRMVLGPAGSLGAVDPDPACETTWRTSTDSGVTWSPAERIADGCVTLSDGADSLLPAWWLDGGSITMFLNGEGQLIAERP